MLNHLLKIDEIDRLVSDYPHKSVGHSRIIKADCLKWLAKIPENSFHGIVTDPPYGLTEYDADQLEKRDKGRGGIWRLPPAFDGAKRAPLPRFTALNERERKRLADFFEEWSRLVVRGIKPGGHVFIATNSFMSQLLFGALVVGGLEYRGEIIRLVKTLRGGDRPKNAENEFPNVSSLPKGCFEPWGVFRKPLPAKMTVAECLRTHGTGGIRRTAEKVPLDDVVSSERTPKVERQIAKHPSLKPQSFHEVEANECRMRFGGENFFKCEERTSFTNDGMAVHQAADATWQKKQSGYADRNLCSRSSNGSERPFPKWQITVRFRAGAPFSPNFSTLYRILNLIPHLIPYCVFTANQGQLKQKVKRNNLEDET